MSQGLASPVSAIRANQAALNVISNNIANLNTVAFKSSSVNFKTLFSQTLSTGSRPNSNSGGVNPQQVGYGVAVGEITQNFAQGGSSFTGRTTDYSIEGQGFFTFENPSTSTATSSGYYLSRAGNLILDGNGNLVSSEGNKVLGTATVNGNNDATVSPIRIPDKLTLIKEFDSANAVVKTWIDTYDTVTAAPTPGTGNSITSTVASLINFSVGSDGAITGTYSNGDRISVQTDPNNSNAREIIHITSEGTSYSASFGGATHNTDGLLTIRNTALAAEEIQLRLATVTNPAGLLSEGGNNFNISPNSGTVSFGIANNTGRGKIQGGTLESSNVDIAGEFSKMIIAQRGIEAAGKILGAQSEVLRTIINIQT